MYKATSDYGSKDVYLAVTIHYTSPTHASNSLFPLLPSDRVPLPDLWRSIPSPSFRPQGKISKILTNRHQLVGHLLFSA